MSIVLVGYRGSGKTTIGKRLADRLWQPFVDIDELIVKRSGRGTIREIFETDGEPLFRDLETQVIEEASRLSDHVIGLGGGSLGREQNRRAIKQAGHKVIYLKCDPAELHKRIHSDPQTAATRPALTPHGGNLDEIKNVLAQREPHYREVMTAELDVTHLSPEEAVIYITRLA